MHPTTRPVTMRPLLSRAVLLPRFLLGASRTLVVRPTGSGGVTTTPYYLNWSRDNHITKLVEGQEHKQVLSQQDPKVLFESISKCQTIEDLIQIIQTHKLHFDKIHASMALKSLGRLQNASLVADKRGSAQTSAVKKPSTPPELANIVNSMLRICIHSSTNPVSYRALNAALIGLCNGRFNPPYIDQQVFDDFLSGVLKCDLISLPPQEFSWLMQGDTSVQRIDVFDLPSLMKTSLALDQVECVEPAVSQALRDRVIQIITHRDELSPESLLAFHKIMNAQILTCRSESEIVSLVQKYGIHFNEVNAATVLSTLRSLRMSNKVDALKKPETPGLADAINILLRVICKSFTTRSTDHKMLAIVLTSLAGEKRLIPPFVDQQLFDEFVYHVVQSDIKSWPVSEWSGAQTLRNLARLSRFTTVDPTILENFFKSYSQMCMEHLNSFALPSLIYVCWSLNHVKVVNPVLLKAVENKILAMDDLSALPWDALLCGVHVFPSVPILSYECMRRGMNEFANEALMHLFWVSAKHKEYDHALELMDAIVHECLRRGLEKFSSRDLAFLCEALGNAHDVIRNDSFVREVIGECNRRGQNEFSKQEQDKIYACVAKLTTSVRKG